MLVFFFSFQVIKLEYQVDRKEHFLYSLLFEFNRVPKPQKTLERFVKCNANKGCFIERLRTALSDSNSAISSYQRHITPDARFSSIRSDLPIINQLINSYWRVKMVSVRQYEAVQRMTQPRQTGDTASKTRSSSAQNDVVCMVELGRHDPLRIA